jgi:hypothetical protein
MLLGILDAKDRLTATKPNVAWEKTGGALVPTQTNPDAGVIGPMSGVAPIPMTQSPDAAVAAAETARHHRTLESKMEEDLKIKRVTADPFGQLGINKTPGTPLSSGNATGPTGDEFLKSLPSNIADQVKAIADGRLAIPGGFALKSPYWQGMLQAVAQYDPSFDQVNYNARNATRKAFTSGKEAASLNALNTVMGHLEDLNNAAVKLDNTGSWLVNKGVNAIGGALSSDVKSKLNNFNVARQAVASELERAYRGTGGNMTEIEEWKKSIDNADSPEAVRAAIGQATQLLGSKIDSLGEQYSKGMGVTSKGLDLLTPKAAETFKKFTTPQEAQKPIGKQPKSTPQTNAAGWKLMTDAKGNKAYVSPDGKQFEEVK